MNILVGFDGSHAARDALKLAQHRAKVSDAKVDVVTSMKGAKTINTMIFSWLSSSWNMQKHS